MHDMLEPPRADALRPTLSIVVPAGPGDRAWATLFDDLPERDDVERLLVLADGDSIAGTPALVRTLVAAAGRARQINAGLRAARGAAVWVLHADSRVDAETFAAALRAAGRFADGDAAALCWFALGFHDGPAAMAVNALGANLRSRWFGLPFGDQGFLAPRELFDTLGGFDECVGRGEDHAFVHAARRAGFPLRRLPGRVQTSARRYVEHGWWRTTREHLALTWRQRQTFDRIATP
jgi:GT2 family glycosyltransferase